MLMERVLDQGSLLDTKIPKWFANKDWNFLLSNLEEPYENMVKEFYANAISEGDKLKCWVRGQHFTVIPYYLANILRINRPMFPKPPMYDVLNSDEELLRDTLRENLEFFPNGKSISVSSLSLELRVLTTIMSHNLYPLSSTGYMCLKRAMFLHDLITDEEIDICSHIFHILQKLLRELPQGTAFLYATSFQGYWNSKAFIHRTMSLPTRSQVQSTFVRSTLALVIVKRESRQRVQLLMVVHALDHTPMKRS